MSKHNNWKESFLLSGQVVNSKDKVLDLRAGAALALCGMVAVGETHHRRSLAD